MNTNFVFDNVNKALPVLMTHVLADGEEVGSRLGERTLELTAVGITLDKPWQRELVLPSRKANIAAQIAETMWVLAGRNDIEWLSHYLPRAADFSDDGSAWRAGYGPRLRNYHGVDQLAYIVDLLRKSPGSRQAVATIWDPQVDTIPGKDIACNNWLHFLARKGKLDLMVGIRSNDAMWGWSGINAFEWSALQEIVAGMVDHQVGKLHFSVGSFHLYDRHWAKAGELCREGDAWLDDSPRFDASAVSGRPLDDLIKLWFAYEARIRGGVSVQLEAFPEPMLRSWLRVLQWYWSGDESHLAPLAHTRLAEACRVGVHPKVKQRELPADDPREAFLAHVNKLHRDKHAAYGDSWKRRGEYMILANIARKVDRIQGGQDTTDETQADTALDLMVYLAKYHCWLGGGTGDPEEVEVLLAKQYAVSHIDLVNGFGELEGLAASNAHSTSKQAYVEVLLAQAYSHALSYW